MADFEEDEQVGETPSGRDRVLSSPASPRQDRGSLTLGAGVGVTRDGLKNATIGVSSGVQTDGADEYTGGAEGSYPRGRGRGGHVVYATPSGEVQFTLEDRGSLGSRLGYGGYRGSGLGARRSLRQEMIEEGLFSHRGKNEQLKRIRSEIGELEREIAVRRDELGLMGAECELESIRQRSGDYSYHTSREGVMPVGPGEGVIVVGRESDVGGERGRGYGRGRDPPEAVDVRRKRFMELDSVKVDSRSRLRES